MKKYMKSYEKGVKSMEALNNNDIQRKMTGKGKEAANMGDVHRCIARLKVLTEKIQFENDRMYGLLDQQQFPGDNEESR